MSQPQYDPLSPESRLLASLDFLACLGAGVSWGISVIGPSEVGSCFISGSLVSSGFGPMGIWGVTSTGSEILRM